MILYLVIKVKSILPHASMNCPNLCQLFCIAGEKLDHILTGANVGSFFSPAGKWEKWLPHAFVFDSYRELPLISPGLIQLRKGF